MGIIKAKLCPSAFNVTVFELDTKISQDIFCFVSIQ